MLGAKLTADRLISVHRHAAPPLIALDLSVSTRPTISRETIILHSCRFPLCACCLCVRARVCHLSLSTILLTTSVLILSGVVSSRSD